MTDVSLRGRVAGFPISDEEFLTFRDFFYRKIGVAFGPSKRYFVDRRIAERAHATDCGTFREYFHLLRCDVGKTELQELINLLTVNETYFFRESYQLAALVRYALPEVAARKKRGEPIRIWSLPCSTGEEPYSIAISVLEGWPQSDCYQIEILASDVDTRVLDAARTGMYGERSLQKVSTELRARYFRRFDEENFAIIDDLRESIDFTQLNISSKHEMSRYRSIDIVFCRNVLIYFDDLSRREAVASIYESLVPGGFLFLGHCESMSRMSSLFLSRKLGDCIVNQRPLEGVQQC